MSEYNNQQNNENEGGLFSQDYEAPKRENPYLKKNREKAKAEKAPKPEKPKREKKKRTDSEEVSPYVATSDEDLIPRPAEDTPTEDTPADGEAYAHKRTFSDWMFEHVKLIAALATVVVVLSLVLITDVVDIVGDIIEHSQQANKEEIDLLYVEGLTMKTDPITWSDFRKFRFDYTEAENSLTWMLPVKGTHYEVWISGVSTEKRPTYVRLYDMKTGDCINLGEDDFAAFIEEHS